MIDYFHSAIIHAAEQPSDRSWWLDAQETDLRLHPQQFEIIWRNTKQPHPRRLFRCGKVILVKPRRRDVLENFRTLKIPPFGLGHPDVICASAGKISLNSYQ